ncbi:hypothetical protein OROHE_010980 [Orobanche hederae]
MQGFWIRPKKLVNDLMFKVVDGDARNILCEAVEKHHDSVLVVGSHGYRAIKRFFEYQYLFRCLFHCIG